MDIEGISSSELLEAQRKYSLANIDQVATQIAGWRAGKQFFTPPSIATPEYRDMMLGKLMLVVTEVAEMAEAVRSGDRDNFDEELADTVIRLLDIAGTTCSPLGNTIVFKMAKNETRPAKHGRLCNL